MSCQLSLTLITQFGIDEGKRTVSYGAGIERETIYLLYQNIVNQHGAKFLLPRFDGFSILFLQHSLSLGLFISPDWLLSLRKFSIVCTLMIVSVGILEWSLIDSQQKYSIS